jgi:Trk-type K+ transport system membrane component
MPRIQLQLLITTWLLILTWLGFIGFGLYSWVRIGEIQKFTITYDCEISESLDSTPIEVKARCKALRTRR